MSSRATRRSSSLEAEYQPIPQAPVAAGPARHSLDVNVLDEEDAVDILEDVPEVVVDGKIRAIHFVLGCAVLLPWNGERTIWILPSLLLTLGESNDNRYSIFHVEARRYPAEGVP